MSHAVTIHKELITELRKPPVEDAVVPNSEGGLQAIVPPPIIRAELERSLETDDTLLGDVWRRGRAGESPEDIQTARGAAQPNFVWNYRRVLSALLEGDLPTAPTVRLETARRLRGFLRRTALSKEAAAILTHNVAALESGAESEAAREIEDTTARTITTQAEAQAIPGVYVYTLPHYLRYPYDAETGRTLFKVGRSNRSVLQRFHNQTRTTALPEDPVLVRIYPTPDADSVARERQFHELLEAADHDRSNARTGGTEWFLTSLRFLDTIAKTVGLESRQVYDPGTE